VKSPVLIPVDPSRLRLPWSRRDGADPAKLARQFSRYGDSSEEMPPLFVFRATDEELVISDGVTRATRIAKLCPGKVVLVEVTGAMRTPGANLPTVGDRLP
jgi:hypothetical protein